MGSRSQDMANPNAPIIFIPPIMDRNSRNNSDDTKTTETEHGNKPHSASSAKSVSSIMLDPSLLDTNYSDLQNIQQPKFPARTTSNSSFDGLIALAHAASSEYDKKQNKKTEQVLNAEDLLKDLGDLPVMDRKTTRDELMGDSNNDDNINGMEIDFTPTLNKMVSGTPEPST